MFSKIMYLIFEELDVFLPNLLISNISNVISNVTYIASTIVSHDMEIYC